jgi:putative drug exporter of the RND superfamily
VTRFDLIGQYDPFSRESVQLLNHVERHLLDLAADPSSPWHGTAFDFVGITASIRDLEAVNTSDCLRVGVLVSIAVLAVLVFVLRRTLISVYLVFTVLLGYFVTLGITKTFFAWAHGNTFHGLDWKLPLFLFVILVAVGEDYNIYLATRVFEEQRRRGLLEGLRVAVIQTGGIITSCGVIMAGTFASMLTGTLRGMHQLGFALSLGVILDTFIIRTIVVPAFLALWARWLPGKAGNDGPATSSGKEAATGGHPLAAPHWQGGQRTPQPGKAKGAKGKRPAA